MASQGFLVCADISGYTDYLSQSELDHASGVIGDLLNVLVGKVVAPLHLACVVGDAVVSYSHDGSLQPQHIVDVVEDTYVAFRRALQQIIVNTTCTCRACANLGSLDLKFVVHHGPFALQEIGSQEELVGSEVNRLFRLAKNEIKSDLGLHGYAAYTSRAADALGLPQFVKELLPHSEPDPETGRVEILVQDMGAVWEANRHRPVYAIPPEDVLLTVESFVDAPPEVVWEYLTRPKTRAMLFESDKLEVELRADGRLGPDSVYVCWHGDNRFPHTILDWIPPTRYTYSEPLADGLRLTSQFDVASAPGGTIVRYIAAKPTEDRLDNARQRKLAAAYQGYAEQSFEWLKQAIADDLLSLRS